MNVLRNTFVFFVLFALNIHDVIGQSGPEFMRSSVMRGNLVKTVFGNWGVIGQPADKGARGAWIYENNGYIGDVSPVVGAEVRANGKTFHSVVVCPVSRPTPQYEQSPTGAYWTFEPVVGYFNEKQEGVALYSDPKSWPPFWPDKMDDAEDPGWPGSWNGFSGKTTTAGEECYFVMDDNNDKEFNFANNNRWSVAFKPDSINPNRSGLGLEVRVRGMQWPAFLAQDCTFWLYEITNTSTTDYDKVVFGMLVGTYVGTTAAKNLGNEYDDDYSFFDVERDLTYTGDFDDNASRNPLWRGEVGMVGYAFLESPGNPYDGIDNDGDADANPMIPATAPYFEPTDFEPRIQQPGDQVVLIDRYYNRQVVTVPNDSTVFVTRGDSISVVPGMTELSEGNVYLNNGQEIVNPNAYDGVDNDLDGLIDENYYLHYRQIRKDQNGNVLIDRLAPVRHVDYVTGQGSNDLMIDERGDDGIDNDGDWNAEFDDVGADGIPGTNDRGEGDGMPTPNEPNFDGNDVDESDQIGLTSFEYFAPAGELSLADDEDLWARLSPGFFDVPSSIINNLPERGEDGDFIYGSGYFPLRAGETQRFSLALVYGEGGGPQVDKVDLLKNRETVQDIYDSDYRFPPAPDKPTITAVPGDGKVTIYWDRRAEKSFDPVLKKNDFEGYKIYRATDQNFNDVFRITDADGKPIYYTPIAQFDLKDGIEGYFRPGSDLFQQARGASFNLGDDSGLEHSFVDKDVENGRRYFYAVVAYDQGDEQADIFPQENDKRIDILPSGEVNTFQNTAMAIPNAEVAGYVPPEGSVMATPLSVVGTGKLFYNVVDESAQTGHTYRVEFWDTSDDGEDNDGDWNVMTDDVGTDGKASTVDSDGTENNGRPDPGEPHIDLSDPAEYFVPITTYYRVHDLTGMTETFAARDTLPIRLSKQHLLEETVMIREKDGNPVDASRYVLDVASGRIHGAAPGSLRQGEYFTISYEYYPIFKSPYIEKSPWVSETFDTDIFDGVQLSFNNHWTIELDTLKSGWTHPAKGLSYSVRVIDTNFDEEHLLGLSHPADYRIEFYDAVVDTSVRLPQYFISPVPTNFKIFNITDRHYIDYVYVDLDNNRKLSSFDDIVLMEQGQDTLLFTWEFFFTSLIDTLYDYGSGDTLKISLKKPFRSGDVFEFSTEEPSINRTLAADELDKIRVVPNPYVAATNHELPLPPAITSGRGERKIDFIHLPAGSRIHIFTTRGDRVITLEHEKAIHDGTVSWNLKSKENLDVSAGIYFYVVESDVGVKRGKLAIIK